MDVRIELNLPVYDILLRILPLIYQSKKFIQHLWEYKANIIIIIINKGWNEITKELSNLIIRFGINSIFVIRSSQM